MKKVIILSQPCLFSKGLEALLSNESGIEIINWETTTTTAIDCVRKHNPDCVIINCDYEDQNLESIILHMLRKEIQGSIIGLSLEHNRISIYRGEQKEILQVSEIIKAIQG